MLRALDRAIELLRLPRGWNSHGAEPVSEAAFERTVEFLTTYLVEGVAGPVLVPTVRGGGAARMAPAGSGHRSGGQSRRVGVVLTTRGPARSWKPPWQVKKKPSDVAQTGLGLST